MFHKFTLQPAVWHQKPLEFEWDAESGEIKGTGASTVRVLVASALENGEAVGHPYPTTFSISDPLHDAAEMAVLLGNDWILSGALMAAYPKSEDNDEPPVYIDASGKAHQVEPLH